MNIYRITYWYNNCKLMCEIEANSIQEASYLFYMNNYCDNIVSINVVGVADVV